MKKIMAGLILALAFAAPSAAQAAHNPDHQAGTPCANGNPTDLCDPGVTVEVATPQECPTGGIVVVVGEARYLVCNGANGQTGASGDSGDTGATGTTGDSGANGATGATGQTGAAGVNGVSGANGTSGTDGVAGSDGNGAGKCVSNGKAFRVTLPKRFGKGKVKVKVGGKTVTVKPKGNKVSVPRAGRRCGAYAVLVTKKGVRPYVRLFTATPSGNLDGAQYLASISRSSWG